MEHEEGEVVARTLQGLRDRGVRVRIVDHDEREFKRGARQRAAPGGAPEYIGPRSTRLVPVIGFGTLMHTSTRDRRRARSGPAR
jgi:hypothetical protein